MSDHLANRIGPKRAIVDGTLTQHHNAEPFIWTGEKVVESWEATDPAGHHHTAAGYSESTYQPRTDLAWCDMCDDSHDHPTGPRRCRECDAEIVPDVAFGRHTTFIDHGATWDVEYATRHERRRWYGLPDNQIFVDIIEHGAIGPALPTLIGLFGDAPEGEWYG